MHGCGASCLLDMGGQLLHPCVYGTYKTQLVCKRHCLAQTAVCSRTCLALRCLAVAAEEPTSKLTGSESVYKREGQMPWAKSW